MKEYNIAELQALMTSGEVSAESLVEAYLRRIESYDSSGATLNSVIEVNPDASSIAKSLDDERKIKGVRSPLHGIPVLLKDNIDTADNMLSTAASLALVDAPKPKQDAFIVQRLREAGAVILGKTNLSEWANFRSTSAVSGWSSRGGQTRNPYSLDRSPCGSSSGSGVAVAANLCSVAIGTETDGSVLCPASVNGIVGIKPTVGLLSRSGIIPISQTQDTAGPMARTVTDAALLYEAMLGLDVQDSTAVKQYKYEFDTDFKSSLKLDALEGKRVGLAKNVFVPLKHIDNCMEDVRLYLEAAGATIVDIEVNLSSEVHAAKYQVMLYEFKSGLNAYLKARGGKLTSLKDVIAFNESHSDRVLPFFGQEKMLAAQEKGDLSEKAYQQALQDSHVAVQTLIDKTLVDDALDVIVAPTGGLSWTIDIVNGDRYLGSSYSLAAVPGYPSITVPAGYVHGLPMGVTFMGAARADAAIIGYAYAFEQVSMLRRPPEFRASLI